MLCLAILLPATIPLGATLPLMAEHLSPLGWDQGRRVALGYAFSQSIVAISALLGDLAWFLAAGAIAIFLGLRVHAAAHRAFHPWSHRPTI